MLLRFIKDVVTHKNIVVKQEDIKGVAALDGEEYAIYLTENVLGDDLEYGRDVVCSDSNPLDDFDLFDDEFLIDEL